MLQATITSDQSPGDVSTDRSPADITTAKMTTGPSPEDITEAWRSVLPSDSEIRSARRRLHAKAIFIAVLVGLSYYALVLSEFPIGARLAAAGVLVIALVAVGTSIMHDANHGSFSTRKWLNHTLSYTMEALGGSSWLWRFQHNSLHHGNTNVVGYDADIALRPFARLAPAQRWHTWHRFQHIYLWPLYGFLSIKNLLVSDFVALLTKRMDQQPIRQPINLRVVAPLALGKFAHLGWALFIPLMFNPWQNVLLFYIAVSWLVGFTLAIVFQLAHCVDIADLSGDDVPRRGNDFAAHQLRTTVDISSPVPVVGHLFRWLVGGLDHQVEHHLSPRLPHTLYPKVAARFRQTCNERGIVYKLHPSISAAVRSHVRWLRVMGRPVAPAPPAQPATSPA